MDSIRSEVQRLIRAGRQPAPVAGCLQTNNFTDIQALKSRWKAARPQKPSLAEAYISVRCSMDTAARHSIFRISGSNFECLVQIRTPVSTCVRAASLLRAIFNGQNWGIPLEIAIEKEPKFQHFERSFGNTE